MCGCYKNIALHFVPHHPHKTPYSASRYNMRNISALLCYHRANIHTTQYPLLLVCVARPRPCHPINKIFSVIRLIFVAYIYMFRDKVNMCVCRICFYWVLNVWRMFLYMYIYFHHIPTNGK